MNRDVIQNARDDIATVSYHLSQISQTLLQEMKHSKIVDDAKDTAFSLVQTIKANVDNDKLSDAEFRQFIRNSLK